ncbi:MAG TPA: BatA domain-containing protein, partial [Candidatus Kapabacteria bacterium]
MTFLNPFYLFGLAAASLPVLFHLFARKRSRKVEFSSLRFLRKLEKTSMRSVKIRQILLLIVRTLLIACLALAFARPAMKGYLGSFFGSSHANTSMVFLLDNSASMSRSDDRGELLKQAKDAATNIAGILEDGDDVTIIPLASISRDAAYQPIHARRDVEAAINAVRVADRPALLEDGLRMASSVLSSSRNVNKEVYLFSDDQASNLRGANGMKLDSNHAAKLFDASTRFFTMTLGNGEHLNGRNLSLDSLKPITTVFEPGRPIQFEAWVRNTTSDAAQNVSLSLFYNGDRVAQQTVTSIGGNESQHVMLEGPARGSGMVQVRAELEPDALPFDNARYAVFDVPASRKVAIFTQNPSDADFIKLALSQSLGGEGTLPFETEILPPDELRSLSSSVTHYDGIVLELGPTALDEKD